MDFIVSKLKEKSTYAGLLALLSAAGLVIDPEQFGAIATVIVALVGAFEVFRKERSSSSDCPGVCRARPHRLRHDGRR
jgi:hypothetical protein